MRTSDSPLLFTHTVGYNKFTKIVQNSERRIVSPRVSLIKNTYIQILDMKLKKNSGTILESTTSTIFEF